MHNCDHDFFKVEPKKGTEPWLDGCIKVVCVYCGQIRIIGCDGVIKIIKEHGEIKHLENLSEHSQLA